MKAAPPELTPVYVSHQDAKRLDAAARLYEREEARATETLDQFGLEYFPVMRQVAEALSERVYRLELTGRLMDPAWEVAQLELTHEELTVLALGRMQMAQAEAIVGPLLAKPSHDMI
jgi:hypothetical protein